MPRREGSHEKAFYRWCKTRGIICLKLVAMGRRGFPDRAVLLPNGVIIFFEFKRKDDGVLSEHQKDMISKLRKRGFRAEVVYSKEEAIQIVEEYL